MYIYFVFRSAPRSVYGMILWRSSKWVLHHITSTSIVVERNERQRTFGIFQIRLQSIAFHRITHTTLKSIQSSRNVATSTSRNNIHRKSTTRVLVVVCGEKKSFGVWPMRYFQTNTIASGEEHVAWLVDFWRARVRIYICAKRRREPSTHVKNTQSSPFRICWWFVLAVSGMSTIQLRLFSFTTWSRPWPVLVIVAVAVAVAFCCASLESVAQRCRSGIHRGGLPWKGSRAGTGDRVLPFRGPSRGKSLSNTRSG